MEVCFDRSYQNKSKIKKRPKKKTTTARQTGLLRPTGPQQRTCHRIDAHYRPSVEVMCGGARSGGRSPERGSRGASACQRRVAAMAGARRQWRWRSAGCARALSEGVRVMVARAAVLTVVNGAGGGGRWRRRGARRGARRRSDARRLHLRRGWP